MSVAWIILASLIATPTSRVAEPGPRVTTRQSLLMEAIQNFDQAVALSDHDSPAAQRLYSRAREGFSALVEDGVRNAYLYYNLANCDVRLGRLGSAIANYRRALRLRPADPDIRQNLAFARRRCEFQVPSDATSAVWSTVFFWHYDTSQTSRWSAAVGAYALFWLLMLACLVVPRTRRYITWPALLCAVVALAAGISVAWQRYEQASTPEGVVIKSHSVLRKGDGDGYQPQLDRPLTEGVEFRVLNQRSDANANVWYQIELANGIRGWLRAEDVELILSSAQG